jgi:hypothetical protein
MTLVLAFLCWMVWFAACTCIPDSVLRLLVVVGGSAVIGWTAGRIDRTELEAHL